MVFGYSLPELVCNVIMVIPDAKGERKDNVIVSEAPDSKNMGILG